MSVFSMTYRDTTSFDLAVARLMGRVFDAAQSLRSWLAPAEAREPQTAEELLAWAQQFERTQPSYAADLRAAALRHLD